MGTQQRCEGWKGIWVMFLDLNKERKVKLGNMVVGRVIIFVTMPQKI